MPDASVIIATRNRRREVGRAVASALSQTADVEVLLTDDASEDGTAKAISADFPTVRLWQSESARGSLVHRNAMAQAARSPILISLDDDAELCSPRTVAQVLGRFDDPHVAAVGIPFFDAPRPTVLLHRAPPVPGIVLTDYYLGCCAALRRESFLAVGGYDEALVHSGEEPDICARWLARGWVVALSDGDLAIHHVSNRRSSGAAAFHATRSEWRNALTHVPRSALPTELARLSAVALGRCAVRRHPLAVARGVRAALTDRPPREPLEPSLYALWSALAAERRRGAPRTTLADALRAIESGAAPH